MIRIGVDFGGTKIEVAAVDPDGVVRVRRRRPNPGGYDSAVADVVALVDAVDAEVGARSTRVGVGLPGSESPADGLMRNANSLYLNGRPFAADLAAALDRQVRLENDANCLALSEAIDGAAAGHGVVFAAILGTGCGGGLVVDGRLVSGRNRIAGEWGHTPLPWSTPAEHPGRRCWCGRLGCLETWLSGTALQADFAEGAGRTATAVEIAQAAHLGDAQACAALDRYLDRLGRALAALCNVVDPDCIVLGGGVSNIGDLYPRLPRAIAAWTFSDVFTTPVVQAMHGDSSGVRGAARLWPV